MARKKPKQPLSGRDVPSSSVHGSVGVEIDHAERSGGDSDARNEETAIATEETEKPTRKAEDEEAGRRLDSGNEESVKPRRYVPPNCSACTALRPVRTESYTEVYTTRREGEYTIRYCRCGFCGNTFKDAAKS